MVTPTRSAASPFWKNCLINKAVRTA
jgi:hypothetical protein